MIHLYTKYHLNPSNHYWENEWKLIIKSVTDGRTDGWTSPYHNTSRFQQAYNKNESIKKISFAKVAKIHCSFHMFLIMLMLQHVQGQIWKKENNIYLPCVSNTYLKSTEVIEMSQYKHVVTVTVIKILHFDSVLNIHFKHRPHM
jgi:hypothetical protein